MATFEQYFSGIPVEQTNPDLGLKQLAKIFDEENWSPPDDYVRFLDWRNGLVISPDSMKLIGYKFCDRENESFAFGETGSAISEFYGVNLQGNDLFTRQNDYQFSTYAPPGFICIGGHAGLSQLAIATEGKEPGTVYHWPVGRAFADESPESEWQRMAEVVAFSFTELLNKLIIFDY